MKYRVFAILIYCFILHIHIIDFKTYQHEDDMSRENTSAASVPMPGDVSAASAIHLKEKSSPPPQLPKDDVAEPVEDWIEGIPLIMVTSALTIVIFIMLLDTSIISTVIQSLFQPLILLSGC
jgi:hypothetical protein